jgi:hypothetical protein
VDLQLLIRASTTAGLTLTLGGSGETGSQKDMNIMMKRLLALVLFMSLLSVGLWADAVTGGAIGGPVVAPVVAGTDPAFTFTYSDSSGDAATGTLFSLPSGLGDDGLVVVSGSLDVTSSADGGTGLYSLIGLGPSATLSPTGLFEADDLLYPSNDAASGVNNVPGIPYYSVIGGLSYLTNGGLLFGPAGGSGSGLETEINIFGNGGSNNYSFWAESSGGFTVSSGSGTFYLTALSSPSEPDVHHLSVPEPGSLLLLGFMGSLGLGLPGLLKRKLR